MLEAICLIWSVLCLGGIIYILKKGFNEIVKGIQSLDDRLKKIEENINHQKI